MDTNSQSFAEVARKLLKQNRLDADQLRSRLEQARDPGYWRALNPELHVESPARTDLEPEPVSLADVDQCIASMRDYGYFKLPPAVSLVVLQQLVAAIQRLAAEAWPAAFICMYDEPWDLCQIPSARRILTGVLGPAYQLNPNAWAHHVRPQRGESGWRPHLDGKDNPRGRLSLWIPLTHATLDNGCMYVIPRDRLSDELREKHLRKQPLDGGEAELLLQSSYALPAPAGSLLGWAGDVMHWGSVCTGNAPPRISVAIEFLAAAPRRAPGNCHFARVLGRRRRLAIGYAASPTASSATPVSNLWSPVTSSWRNTSSQVVGPKVAP